jgi:hypothetical protein
MLMHQAIQKIFQNKLCAEEAISSMQTADLPQHFVQWQFV